MQIDQFNKINSKLDRIQSMLAESLHKGPEKKITRLTEKKLCEKYEISIHVLKRMRLGYKRKDGSMVDPVLFKWGHVKGRRIDYDVAEFEQAFKRTIL